MAGRKPGGTKTGGRQKGTQNKLTRTVKQVFESVFDSLQDDPEANLEAFAKKSPKEFYAMATKLIPAAVDAKLTGDLKVEIIRLADSK